MTARKKQPHGPQWVKLATTAVFVLLVWFAQHQGWLDETGFTEPPISGTEAADLGRCVKVIDGDTVDVTVDGTRHRIRLLGIDCAETYNESKAAQQARTWSMSVAEVRRLGRQATAAASRHLLDRQVRLVYPDGARVDDYDRLLAYVEVDGTDVAVLLLQEGLAETRREPHVRKAHYQTVQEEARRRAVGLWK